MLVVLGAALGTRRVLRYHNGWVDAACLWVVIVGEPGDAKSPALDKALQPVRIADADAHQTWLNEMKTWQGCQDDGQDCGDRPTREWLLVSDVTVEKLAMVLQDNPRGVLLHRDEFGAWIRSMNQYRGGKGADVPTFSSIWSGQPINVLRKTTEDAYVQRPFVSVLGGIQPDLLDELNSGKDDGFVDRLLLVYPRPVTRRWTNKMVDPATELAYVHLHRALLNLPPAEVPMTDDADAWYGRWSDRFYGWLGKLTGPTRGAAAKMPRYCGRLALILAHARALYDRPPDLPPDRVWQPTVVVTRQDVDHAITLVNYLTVEVRRASDRLVPKVGNLDRNVRAADRVAQQVAVWLQRHEGVATVRELHKAKVGGVRKAVDVMAAVRLLEEDGRVKVELIPAPVGGEANAAKASMKVTLLDCEGGECDEA
jgi:Protein of unknown function (DUF3987)